MTLATLPPAAGARQRPGPTAGAPAPQRSAARPSRPSLQVVAPAAGSRRALMAITLLAVLGGGLAGLLLLHTWAAQDGFRLASLQQQQARLATRIQALTARDQRLESPDRLQAAATALGMRPTGDPRFVRLSSGKLVGKAVAVPAPPPPAPESLSPAAQAQAQVRGHARARQGGRAAPPAGRSADPQVGGKARASRRAQPGGTQSARSHPRHTG